MTLPYSRTVNVTVSKNTGFASSRGFGVPLFLTSQAVAGVLDADNLTKVYGSLDEVAADFSATDEFYKAAIFAFSQNPRPLQIKAGFYSPTDAAAPTAAELSGAMDAIVDIDDNFYFLSVESQIRDVPGVDGLISWTETKNKIFMLDSNDDLHQNPADTTNVSARHKGTVERTAVFYHTDADTYGAFAFAALLGTQNFDDANSAYTGKFKRLQGINNVNLGSAAIQAITGFIPAGGQDESAGHCANTYIDIGQQNFTTEGSTLTQNVFIDEIHASDWIKFRTEERILEIFLNNNRIPFTDQGMQILASAPREVMAIARRAGLIAEDLNPETGDFEPSVIISVPSVFDVSESQRKRRIAPAIQVDFRYSGAVHYATINYSITF